MLRESFLGRRPSHFHLNPIVRAFILSETFLWAAWNFTVPILGVFAANNIIGGNVEIAASSFSIYLVVRVIFELLAGRFLSKSNNREKFLVTIFGITIISVSYLGLAFSNTVLSLFLFYGMTGMGIGIASPPKNSLFSSHLDKSKETEEWGLYDGITFLAMALAAALGGFIASRYGFSLLFALAAVVNSLSSIPYVLYMSRAGKHH